MFGSLGSLIAAFKFPDLRKRILFVFLMFGVFVVGLHIPVPGITRAGMPSAARISRDHLRVRQSMSWVTLAQVESTATRPPRCESPATRPFAV